MAPQIDFQSWLWSLPRHLGAGPNDLGRGVAYLRAEPSGVERRTHRFDRQRFNSDSPWCPPVRLFRQQRINDWGPVFDAMAAALPGLVQRRGGPTSKGKP